jgi:MFS family permease
MSPALNSVWDYLIRFFVGIDRKTEIKSLARQGMFVANIEGMYATIYFNLVSGAFLTGYALYLGMNDFHIGLLGAIPAISNVPAIFSAYWAERIGSRKRIIIPAITFSRFLWLPLLLLPFISENKTVVVWSFLGIYLISALSGGICINTWQSWISDIVPEKIRGRFWGRRSRILSVASIVTLLLGGIILDAYKAADLELYGYVSLFVIALIFAGLSSFMLKKQSEPIMEPLESVSLLENILKPYRDREYRKIIISFALFNGALGLSAAFFSAYMLEYLKMSYSQISMFSIFSLIVGIFFNLYWGHIMDSVGLKPVLLINLVIISVIPLLWTLALTTGLWLLVILWALVGIGWSGFNLAALNLPFSFSPKQGRSYYLGVLHITSGITFFISSVLAGVLAEHLFGLDTYIGGLHIIHYHVLFIASSIFRLASGLMLIRVKESKDKGVLYTISLTSNIVYTKLMAATRIVLFSNRNNGNNDDNV